MATAGKAVSFKAGWEDVMLNPPDKSTRLSWCAEEQLVVVQEAQGRDALASGAPVDEYEA